MSESTSAARIFCKKCSGEITIPGQYTALGLELFHIGCGPATDTEALSRDLAAARRENAELREQADSQANITETLDALAEVLGVKDYEIHDGTETVEGDVAATIVDILGRAGLWDVEENRKLDAAELRERVGEEIAQFAETAQFYSWVPGILAERIRALTKSSK